MPIAEFPAVISPESILRGGTGDFSARRAPTQPHRGQIAGFKPPTDNHRRPPTTATKNDQQATTMGVRSAIIAPDAHHHVPLTDADAQVSGIHPASSYFLFRSGLLKRLIEVGNQIICILNAHGQTHQVSRNLKRRPGHRGVGHGRRQLNQGFHAAK